MNSRTILVFRVLLEIEIEIELQNTSSFLGLYSRLRSRLHQSTDEARSAPVRPRKKIAWEGDNINRRTWRLLDQLDHKGRVGENIVRSEKAAPSTSHQLLRCQVVLTKRFVAFGQHFKFEFWHNFRLGIVTISVIKIVTISVLEFCHNFSVYVVKIIVSMFGPNLILFSFVDLSS